MSFPVGTRHARHFSRNHIKTTMSPSLLPSLHPRSLTMLLSPALLTFVSVLLCWTSSTTAHAISLRGNEDTPALTKRCYKTCPGQRVTWDCHCAPIIPRPTCKFLCREEPEVFAHPVPPGYPPIKPHGPVVCGLQSRQHYPIFAQGIFHQDAGPTSDKGWHMYNGDNFRDYFEGHIKSDGETYMKSFFTVTTERHFIVGIRADTWTYYYELDSNKECGLKDFNLWWNLQDITVLEKTH